MPDKTFLARAVDRLGHAKFEDDWVGVRFRGKPAPFPAAEDRMFATQAQILQAGRLVRDNLRPLWEESPPELRSNMKLLSGQEGGHKARFLAEVAMQFSETQWDKAEELRDQLPIPQSNPKTQWRRVISEINRSILDGSLDCYVRGLRGGAFRPFSKDKWNMDDWAVRFHACRVNERDPYSDEPIEHDSEEGSYLYVSKERLRALLVQRLGGAPDDEALDYEPPYLALLIAVCRDLRITQDNCPTPTEVRDALARVWEAKMPGEPALSTVVTKKMVTILRYPNADNGRTQKK